MAVCGTCRANISMFSGKRNCRRCRTSFHDNGRCVKTKSIFSNQIYCPKCGSNQDSTVG